MINKIVLCSSLVLFILLSITTKAQLKLKLGAESGLYATDESLLSNNQNLEARLDAKLSYYLSSSDYSLLTDVRIRPEIYGLSENLAAFKFKSTCSFTGYAQGLNWGIKLNTYYYNFSTAEFTSDFKMGDISANLFIPVGSANSVYIESGYAYRLNEANAELEIGSVLAGILFYQHFKNGLHLGAGINFDKFNASYNTDNNSDKLLSKNKGYRYGPVISLDFTGSIIARSTVTFFVHDSDITNSGSNEYSASLVLGKQLTSEFSLMMLVDYYKNHFKFNDGIDSEKYLYFPSNIENQVAVKLGYDLLENSEVYIKVGYFNLDLLIESQVLTGWNLLVGIQKNLF